MYLHVRRKSTLSTDTSSESDSRTDFLKNNVLDQKYLLHIFILFWQEDTHGCSVNYLLPS